MPLPATPCCAPNCLADLPQSAPISRLVPSSDIRRVRLPTLNKRLSLWDDRLVLQYARVIICSISEYVAYYNGAAPRHLPSMRTARPFLVPRLDRQRPSHADRYCSDA